MKKILIILLITFSSDYLLSQDCSSNEAKKTESDCIGVRIKVEKSLAYLKNWDKSTKNQSTTDKTKFQGFKNRYSQIQIDMNLILDAVVKEMDVVKSGRKIICEKYSDKIKNVHTKAITLQKEVLNFLANKKYLSREDLNQDINAIEPVVTATISIAIIALIIERRQEKFSQKMKWKTFEDIKF